MLDTHQDMLRHIQVLKTTLASSEAEIERLRDLKTPASRQLLEITKGAVDNAEAEITGLRALLRRWLDMKLLAESSMLMLEIRKALANKEIK